MSTSIAAATRLQFWTKDISNRTEKEHVAEKIADFAREGDVIGFGSGSTAYLALLALAKSGKKIRAVPTSLEITYLCKIHDIETVNLFEHSPDWCFDGADEVDGAGNMIKGRGGALLREKQVMLACKGPRLILIDASKRVEKLGTSFKIPVEVARDQIFEAEAALHDYGAREISLRMAQAKDGPVITESGHVLFDIKLDPITDNSEADLKQLSGVIETGLFTNLNPHIILPDTRLSRSLFSVD